MKKTSRGGGKKASTSQRKEKPFGRKTIRCFLRRKKRKKVIRYSENMVLKQNRWEDPQGREGEPRSSGSY